MKPNLEATEGMCETQNSKMATLLDLNNSEGVLKILICLITLVTAYAHKCTHGYAEQARALLQICQKK